METYKIEKNVPLPVQSGPCKYPFAEMEVGDSILVRNVGKSSILSYARYWSAKNKNKYAWYAEQEKDGVRIWRRR